LYQQQAETEAKLESQSWSGETQSLQAEQIFTWVEILPCDWRLFGFVWTRP